MHLRLLRRRWLLRRRFRLRLQHHFRQLWAIRLKDRLCHRRRSGMKRQDSTCRAITEFLVSNFSLQQLLNLIFLVDGRAYEASVVWKFTHKILGKNSRSSKTNFKCKNLRIYPISGKKLSSLATKLTLLTLYKFFFVQKLSNPQTNNNHFRSSTWTMLQWSSEAACHIA
jgi:hypothetical protein